jgi:hypothetical protein
MLLSACIFAFILTNLADQKRKGRKPRQVAVVPSRLFRDIVSSGKLVGQF